MTMDLGAITGPLKGMRILDFTQAYAGPFATMMLADLGATVVKVEAPQGDSTRNNGPYLNDRARALGASGYNNSVNRNKYNICLNLREKEAQDIAHELVKRSDAMIFNFSSPRIMEKYNLSYEKAKELNPAVVYVSMSGYGTNRVVGSLHEDKPTVDLMMQAECGSISITGSRDGELYKYGPGIGDSYTGTVAAVALLAGVVSARETGRGQFIDIAMLDSMIALTERIIYQYSYTGVVPGPEGNSHPMQAPYSLYDCVDGKVCICGTPQKYWERLCNAMGKPEYASDPRFADQFKRRENLAVVDGIVAEWAKGRRKKEIISLLEAHDCLASPVNDARDLFEDPHVAAREMIVEVEGDPVTGDKVKIAGTPFKFSDTGTGIRHRGPLKGENSVDILGGLLGYDSERIQGLIRRGAVAVTEAALERRG